MPRSLAGPTRPASARSASPSSTRPAPAVAGGAPSCVRVHDACAPVATAALMWEWAPRPPAARWGAAAARTAAPSSARPSHPAGADGAPSCMMGGRTQPEAQICQTRARAVQLATVAAGHLTTHDDALRLRKAVSLGWASAAGRRRRCSDGPERPDECRARTKGHSAGWCTSATPWERRSL